MSPKREPRSLLELAVARGGFITARRALLFGTAWLIAERAMGQTPTVEEYGEHWGQSRAQSFREQQAFRKCFPGFDTPTELAAAVGYRAPAKTSPTNFMEFGLCAVPA